MMDQKETRRGRGRALLAVGVVGLLLAAGACKSSSSSSSSSTSASGSSASSGASASSVAATVDDRAPGVTADTIKVGVTYPDLASLKDVLHIDNGDYAKAFQTAADDINAKGGINGRKLQVVAVGVNPTQPNAFDAACTKLTQDEKVFVVLGFQLGDNVNCYINTNPTPTIGGEQTTDRLSGAQVAWYTTDASQDLQGDVAKALADGGKLAGKVAIVGNATDQAIYESSIKPALTAAKVNIVDEAFIDAPSTDAEANYAQAQTFSEKFKADGAEQVLVVGNSASPGFVTGLSRTDFRPQLRFTQPSSLAAYTSATGSDLSPLTGAASGGIYDGGSLYPKLGDPTKECLAGQTAAGFTLAPANTVAPGATKQITSSGQACQQMYLLKAILEKAGPTLNFGTFKTAGDNLGPVVLPMAPDPWTFGPPPSADGNPKVYLSAWDPTSKSMQQVG
jgi:hypothetical protein